MPPFRIRPPADAAVPPADAAAPPCRDPAAPRRRRCCRRQRRVRRRPPRAESDAAVQHPPGFHRSALPPLPAAVAAETAPAAAETPFAACWAAALARRARGGRRLASVPCHGRCAGAGGAARRQPRFLPGYAAGRGRRHWHQRRWWPIERLKELTGLTFSPARR